MIVFISLKCPCALDTHVRFIDTTHQHSHCIFNMNRFIKHVSSSYVIFFSNLRCLFVSNSFHTWPRPTATKEPLASERAHIKIKKYIFFMNLGSGN